LYKSTILRTAEGDIGHVMSLANAEVSRDNPEMLFVTAFAGILDLESGDLVYCNAGQDNPYLLHPADTTIRRLTEGGGPPLCAVDDFAYREARYSMRPGEELCLITDGVTDARDGSGGMYGGERLQNLLRTLTQQALGARALVDAVRADVESFVAGGEAVDDLTVLALRWNGADAPRN
jgi:serine phosphatase RsbU (regulator of sigma subunit)